MDESRIDDTGQILEVRRIVVVRLDRRVAVAVAMCFLSCVVMCALTFVYTTRSSHAQVHAFCALLGTYDSAYRQYPPQTDTGRTLAAEVHGLLLSLDC